MTMQQAVEAPRISSQSFPNSFAPHAYYPGRLNVEEDLGPEVIAELRRRGHDVEVWPRFPAANAAVCAIKVDPENGTAARRRRSSARGLRAGVVRPVRLPGLAGRFRRQQTPVCAGHAKR